jgi:hypothetical protein
MATRAFRSRSPSLHARHDELFHVAAIKGPWFDSRLLRLLSASLALLDEAGMGATGAFKALRPWRILPAILSVGTRASSQNYENRGN